MKLRFHSPTIVAEELDAFAVADAALGLALTRAGAKLPGRIASDRPNALGPPQSAKAEGRNAGQNASMAATNPILAQAKRWGCDCIVETTELLMRVMIESP